MNRNVGTLTTVTTESHEPGPVPLLRPAPAAGAGAGHGLAVRAPWWRWPAELLLTWLMPWRAARTIREQREDMRLLTLMLAVDVATASEQIERTRASGWWNRPRPLAVVLAALMPWRAVEDLRSVQRSFRYVTAKLAAIHRQDKAPDQAPDPRPRHLHVVR